MHGRKRETVAQAAERRAASAPKARLPVALPLLPSRTSQAALYAKLQAAVLAKRASQSYGAEGLALSARLLELNPEVYTAWNLRRDTLEVTLLETPPPKAAEVLGAHAHLFSPRRRRRCSLVWPD